MLLIIFSQRQTLVRLGNDFPTPVIQPACLCETSTGRIKGVMLDTRKVDIILDQATIHFHAIQVYDPVKRRPGRTDLISDLNSHPLA